jgi:phage FluMu protein Com
MKLPDWIEAEFQKRPCPHCKKLLNLKGVIAQGIRDEPRVKTKLLHFVEYKCSSCKQITFFTVPITLEEFVDGMQSILDPQSEQMTEEDEEFLNNLDPESLNLDELEKELGMKKSKKKSQITDEEVNSLKKILDNTEYYEDFLDKLNIDIHPNQKDKDSKDEDKK